MARVMLYLIGTFGGTGFAPIAPATVASFAFTLLWWWLGPPVVAVQTALIGGVFLVGVVVAGKLEEWHGKDPGLVVIDEVAGMLVTFWGVATGPAGWLAGFLWFRFFDIFKPFPVRRLERAPGGWGIMLDDIGAGIYAWIALQLTLRYIPLDWNGWGL